MRMESKLVTIICMWKGIYSEQNRVVAEEIRRAAKKDTTHSVKAVNCLECDGSKEYAEKINCPNYTIPGEK